MVGELNMSKREHKARFKRKWGESHGLIKPGEINRLLLSVLPPLFLRAEERGT